MTGVQTCALPIFKAQDLQRKATKDQQDFILKQQDQQIERERIAANQETAGANMALKLHEDNKKREHAHETAGFQAGMDLHKHNTNLDEQRAIAFDDREHQARLERMRQDVQQKLAETAAKQKPNKPKGE